MREPFSVGVLATGTEIHEGRTVDLDSPRLVELIRSWQHDPVVEGSVPDEYEAVEAKISELAEAYDVVVTTGGPSAGHKDHVINVFSSLGEIVFHHVRLRLGKPIAVADFPDHDAVAVAIPGKPIAASASASLIVRPLFTGEPSLPTVTATLKRRVNLSVSGFDYAIPVLLKTGTQCPSGTPIHHWTYTSVRSIQACYLRAHAQAARMDSV